MITDSEHSQPTGLDPSLNYNVPGSAEPLSSDEPIITVLNATSGGTITEAQAQIQFTFALENGTKAFILAGTTNGTVPEHLNPLISHSVEQGVPVIVLSTNYAYDTGPHVSTDAPYESQVALVKAGATILRDRNINGLREVMDTINEGFNEGYRGPVLNNLIVERFGVPEGLAPYSVAK